MHYQAGVAKAGLAEGRHAGKHFHVAFVLVETAKGDERVRERDVWVVQLRAQRLEEAVVLLPQAVHELVDGRLLLGGGREGGRVERHRRPAAPARLPPAMGEGSR